MSHIAITAPSAQSVVFTNESWMKLPNMLSSEPPTSEGATNSPVVGMRTKTNAAITPGQAQRQRHPQERQEPVRAEVLGGLEDSLVEVLENDEDRQGDERDPRVREDEADRELRVVEPLHRDAPWPGPARRGSS